MPFRRQWCSPQISPGEATPDHNQAAGHKPGPASGTMRAEGLLSVADAARVRLADQPPAHWSVDLPSSTLRPTSRDRGSAGRRLDGVSDGKSMKVAPGVRLTSRRPAWAPPSAGRRAHFGALFWPAHDDARFGSSRALLEERQRRTLPVGPAEPRRHRRSQGCCAKGREAAVQGDSRSGSAGDQAGRPRPSGLARCGIELGRLRALVTARRTRINS